MRLENRCLHGLGRVVFGREVGSPCPVPPYFVLTASQPAGTFVACTGNERTSAQSAKLDNTQRWLETGRQIRRR